ncbi:MAG: hypothetical protein ACI9OJ_005428 [Myxococcota bacterium]
MIDRAKRVGWVFAVLVASACSSEAGSSESESDAATDVATGTATYGDPCSSDAECGTGLCISNETAPFGWCSATCDVAWEACPADTAGNITGFCAEFPESFGSTPRRFCLPICTDDFGCKGRSELWETCKEPSYKGNVLNGSLTGIRVCQAPSQHGKPLVDSDTCADWAAGYQDSFTTQVNVCKAYCDYLESCKQTSTVHTTDCCGYGCILRMTPEGVVNTIYDKDIKCFVQSFNANIGNAQVCSAPPNDCSHAPEDPTPE